MLRSRVLPIQFGVPSELVVPEVPPKSVDFSPLVPGRMETYIYGPDDEDAYHRGYRDSRFAITTRKWGWDCLRHYEILAAGAIPYFPRLWLCPPRTMAQFPKSKILRAMTMRGVTSGVIDPNKFSEERYHEHASILLEATRTSLTTTALARRFLGALGCSAARSVLVLSEDSPEALGPDYQRCLLVHGLKELLGANAVIDAPRVEHLYKTTPERAAQLRHSLWGHGFTYAMRLPDEDIDRTNIEQRIRRRDFDLVVYGSVHRGLPHWDLVTSNYPNDRVALVDGEDIHECEIEPRLASSFPYFRREIDGLAFKLAQTVRGHR